MRNATRTPKADARGTFGKNGWSNIANLAAVLEAPIALKSEPKAKKAPKAEKTSVKFTITATVAKVLCHADTRAWVTLSDAETDTLVSVTVEQAATYLPKLGHKVTVACEKLGGRIVLA